MDRDVQRAICQALIDSFSELEFRSFFDDVAAELRASLPTNGTLTSLIEEAVQLLDRHGRLDAKFFLRWRDLRPIRSARIAELEAMVGSQPESSAGEERAGAAASEGSASLKRLSPGEVALRSGGFLYFLFMAHEAKNSRNVALLFTGGFLLGIMLPEALSRGRFPFLVTLVVGVGVIVYARFLDSRQPDPST